MLNDWVAAVMQELGVEADIDIDTVLDVAKVAAHSVERPAAPLTTFLMGFAAAQRGGTGTLPELSEQIVALAREWRASPR